MSQTYRLKKLPKNVNGMKEKEDYLKMST